jgi:hypothetical protein
LYVILRNVRSRRIETGLNVNDNLEEIFTQKLSKMKEDCRSLKFVRYTVTMIIVKLNLDLLNLAQYDLDVSCDSGGKTPSINSTIVVISQPQKPVPIGKKTRWVSAFSNFMEKRQN